MSFDTQMKECGSRDRGLSEFVGVNHMTEYVWHLPVGEYNNGRVYCRIVYVNSFWE
jgi:hypothetical protein